MASRDGVDDFYEAFGNWPQLYLLGGADDLLPSSVRHWEAVTAQLTELGMLHDEFDKGYDWFHIGEGLLFFYQLCMTARVDSPKGGDSPSCTSIPGTATTTPTSR